MLKLHPFLNRLLKNYFVLRRKTHEHLSQFLLRRSYISFIFKKLITIVEKIKKKCNRKHYEKIFIFF